ncbi:MurR/RpiR family transcriptional regulator [Anaerobacillus alkaliphilus]|uniref:MurR/RpiR family transcriptional regulator n=1 Tax=Anaerobacillus alkaliphilus TaxID=1548597 RepID=A0A4Q0VLA2_9BACI|nr:MurR/RpiR family transcriptional regulator [Anaerobacillus alkaliphilus]RXI96178.1 MurR/RpiR family transcriptional regulator [Anaerobacillus alkaliphilus]
MEKIKKRVKENYNGLTQRMKLVANFIVENPNQIALNHAKEIGNLTSTSETTVIRCCHALGYSGYAEVQEEIRKALIMPDDDPFKALTEGIKSNSSFLSTVNQDIEFIGKTLQEFNETTYEEAVRQIINANKIIVVGLRTSYAPAHWLANILNIVRGNTVTFKGDIDDANHQLTEVTDESLVIALSFPRYAQQTISFAKAAKEKGAKVLSITDDELSPVGLISDTTIKIITPKPTTFKGMPTIFSILNAVISGVMVMDQENVEKRIEEYDRSKDYYYGYYKKD